MTDAELIESLRSNIFGTCTTMLAADRIEALIAERKKAVDAFVDLARATLAEIKGESHE